MEGKKDLEEKREVCLHFESWAIGNVVIVDETQYMSLADAILMKYLGCPKKE